MIQPFEVAQVSQLWERVQEQKHWRSRKRFTNPEIYFRENKIRKFIFVI